MGGGSDLGCQDPNMIDVLVYSRFEMKQNRLLEVCIHLKFQVQDDGDKGKNDGEGDRRPPKTQKENGVSDNLKNSKQKKVKTTQETSSNEQSLIR